MEVAAIVVLLLSGPNSIFSVHVDTLNVFTWQ